VFYVISWFVLIGPTSPAENFITGKKVNIFFYENGPIQKLNRKILSVEDPNSYRELIDGDTLVLFAHYTYRPLELVSNIFNYQYLGEFHRTNTYNLTIFNSSSDEIKIKHYEDFKEYHDTVLECFGSNFNMNEKLQNEARSKKVKTRKFLFKEFDIGNEKRVGGFYRTSIDDWCEERLYYNFEDYKKTVLEGRKFTNWFNKVNITENNPNFDKEFVEKFRAYLNETENQPY
jgi:hypothetical protein